MRTVLHADRSRIEALPPELRAGGEAWQAQTTRRGAMKTKKRDDYAEQWEDLDLSQARDAVIDLFYTCEEILAECDLKEECAAMPKESKAMLLKLADAARAAGASQYEPGWEPTRKSDRPVLRVGLDARRLLAHYKGQPAGR
jgi:hypothetical protein